MPVTAHHAFAHGTTFPAPERLRQWCSDITQLGAADRIWTEFRSNAEISDDALLGPDAVCVNCQGDRSVIRIGAGSIVRGILRIEMFGAGCIAIGARSYIGDDTILSSAAGITLGNEVLLAHGVQIFDNDTHPIDWRERRAHFAALVAGKPFDVPIATRPVTIGDNGWVGMNSLVMKGAIIGARSILAAGSVLIGEVPPDTLAAGNPAHKIRDLAATEPA